MIRLQRGVVEVFPRITKSGYGRQNVKKILRIVLTILMYAGVLVFLIPYFRGTITTSIIFLIVGAGFAVLCGLLRCYLTEGDCGRIPHHSRDW
jgi:membrane protein CcdC involved in cytochrome C biogenesis